MYTKLLNIICYSMNLGRYEMSNVQEEYDKYFGNGTWEDMYKAEIVRFAENCIQSANLLPTEKTCPECKGHAGFGPYHKTNPNGNCTCQTENITLKVEELLDAAWELIADESARKYLLYNIHRRITERCAEITVFFE